MTKKELLQALESVPDDMRIVVRGYEGGYDDIERLQRFEVIIDAFDKPTVYGAHEQPQALLQHELVDCLEKVREEVVYLREK